MRYSLAAFLIVLGANAAFAQTVAPRAAEPVSPQAAIPTSGTQPFGSNLFTGAFSKDRAEAVNPDYTISPGDKVQVKLWGGTNFEQALTVDNQGNIFLPDLGPVKLEGVRQADLNSVIASKAGSVYKDNVGVYTNLQGSLPVSVFVAGPVRSPGRYTGISTDSVLDYLDRAGGIDANRGSYRVITVMRNNQPAITIDIYEFLRAGRMPKFRLQEGDTIFVSDKGRAVTVADGAVNRFAFEFLPGQSMTGDQLVSLASPLPGTTDALIEGVRDGKPYKAFQSLANFSNVPLENGDVVAFIQGQHALETAITISGTHMGPKRMVVAQDIRLKDVLANVPVSEQSDTRSIYIRRKSVALKQKVALQDSLKRLEETMLLARTAGVTQTSAISEAEAKILEAFIARAAAIQPEGRVVVTRDGQLSDVALEDGDEIVIPQKTDVVSVNGEVLVPQAIVWQRGDTVMDYIRKSGGFSDRANESQLVVIGANGATQIGEGVTVHPGDEIMVLPEVKLNNLQVAGTVMEIIYKAAVAAAIPFRL